MQSGRVPRLLQLGYEWSVQTDDEIVEQLSESMAWEYFLFGKSVNAKLVRNGKLMALRDFSSPVKVQRT